MRDACSQLAEAGIRASLFIDPEPAQLDAAVAAGAPVVELHTGSYADAEGEQQKREFERVARAAHYGHDIGLSPPMSLAKYGGSLILKRAV